MLRPISIEAARRVMHGEVCLLLSSFLRGVNKNSRKGGRRITSTLSLYGVHLIGVSEERFISLPPLHDFLVYSIIIFSLQCEHPRHEYCAQRNIKCVTEGCIDFLCLPVFPFFGSPRNIIVIIILPL